MTRTPAVLPSLTALRWLVALALTVVCFTFATFLAHSASASTVLLQALAVLAVALATYSWVIYSMAGAVFSSAAVVVGLIWYAAASSNSLAVWDLIALAMLIGAAVMQRRRRMRARGRMHQLLGNMREEDTVKNQALQLAQQTTDNLQKKDARYRQLQSIAERLSNLLEADRITQLAVDSAFELIGKSDVCLLFLVNTERQALSLVASRKAPEITSIRAKHGDQFDRYVLRTHRPLLVNDVRKDFRFTEAGGPTRPISSVIACPLLLQQRAEGVLRLDSAKPGAYTQDDLRFLDILLDLVATAIMNARLFAETQQLAMTDGLTGLWLRRPFMEQLDRELIRAGRHKDPVSVLMFDLDNFKAYNDTLGHTAGDAALSAVAQILRHCTPPDSVCARYGGEEFAVMLPKTDRAAGQQAAERIRAATEEVKRASRGTRPITVSGGLACFPEDAKDDLELLRVADDRLYQAKRAGRNRVVA